MQTINGVDVLTTIEELVEPANTAVIVIDMQNEIVSPEGGYARSGTNVFPVAFIIPGIQHLLKRAREVGILVIYAEFIHRNRLGVTLMDGPNTYHLRSASFVSDVIEDSWEARTVNELAPQTGDIIIRKSRGSAMYNTCLDDVLKARRAKNLIITGTLTEGCVLRTAIDVTQHGYYPVIVRDCVSSYNKKMHELALLWMESRLPVFNLNEILSVWKKK